MMEQKRILATTEAPTPKLSKITACALAVGGKAFIHTVRDESAVHVEFPGAGDITHFDPIDNTLHALELIHVARRFGFVVINGNGKQHMPYVVRVVWSAEDVRVQIGASKWFRCVIDNTGHAFRAAVVDAFSSYYYDCLAQA